MSDAAPTLNLHSLEQDLQNRLHAEPTQTQPMQVRCVFKEGILIILVQHGAPKLPYPRRVFRAIRQFLFEGGVLAKHQVLTYLRVEGSNQPYAFHTLTEQSKPQVAETLDEELEDDTPETIFTEEHPLEEPGEGERFTPLVEPSEPEPTPILATETEVEEWEEPLDFGGEPEETDADYQEDSYEEEDLGFEGFTSAEDGFAGDAATERRDEVGDRRLSKATLTFAACLALAFSGTAFYVLSRPCVIDRCANIPRADELSDQAIKTFQSNPSGQQILTAQGQLSEAVKKLEAIPFWSPRYTEAQEKLKDYRDLSASLDTVINALYKAAGAAQLSQNPPFPAEKWAEIAGEWQGAIAGLSEIPPQDFFHPFAQQKIDDYERNLNAINLRLTQQEEAVEVLEQAKEEAKIAQVQQGVAQSLDSWEQAYLSWASAIQKLEAIPEGTTAYKEAQDLIANYAPQMDNTKESQDKEAIARNIYEQGTRIAQLARDAAREENWEEAVFHWKNAVRYLEQIPADTYQASLTEPAIAEYKQRIEESQVQLQLYTRLKQAENDLQRTCAGNPNICNYTIDASNIKVRLTAAYVKEVQETAVQASATNNSDAKIRILDHIATLEQALEVISQNTSVPVQVYDVNGVLLVDYKP